MFFFGKPPGRITQILVGIEKREMVPPLLARQSLIELFLHRESAFCTPSVI
jgi:hypothetical protein